MLLPWIREDIQVILTIFIVFRYFQLFSHDFTLSFVSHLVTLCMRLKSMGVAIAGEELALEHLPGSSARSLWLTALDETDGDLPGRYDHRRHLGPWD